MKKTLQSSLLVFSSIILFTSCSSNVDIAGLSVQKRKYRGGYTVIVDRSGSNKVAKANCPDELLVKCDDSVSRTSLAIECEKTSDLALTACTNEDVDKGIISSKSIEQKLENNTYKTVRQLKTLYSSDVNNLREFRQKYKEIKRGYLLGSKENEEFDSVQRHSRNPAMAILSFVFGIVGLVVAGLIFGILAIVFGSIGLTRKLKGLALAGIILGIIDIVGWLIVMTLIF